MNYQNEGNLGTVSKTLFQIRLTANFKSSAEFEEELQGKPRILNRRVQINYIVKDSVGGECLGCILELYKERFERSSCGSITYRARRYKSFTKHQLPECFLKCDSLVSIGDLSRFMNSGPHTLPISKLFSSLEMFHRTPCTVNM